MTRRKITEDGSSERLNPNAGPRDAFQDRSQDNKLFWSSEKGGEASLSKDGNQGNLNDRRSEMDDYRHDGARNRQGYEDKTSEVNPGLQLRDWMIGDLSKGVRPHSEGERTGQSDARGYETFGQMKNRARDEIMNRDEKVRDALSGKRSYGDTSADERGQNLPRGGAGQTRQGY